MPPTPTCLSFSFARRSFSFVVICILPLMDLISLFEARPWIPELEGPPSALVCSHHLEDVGIRSCLWNSTGFKALRACAFHVFSPLSRPQPLLRFFWQGGRRFVFGPSPLVSSLRSGRCSSTENIDNSSLGSHYIPSLQMSVTLPWELLIEELEGTW